jgi:hypothetical protein
VTAYDSVVEAGVHGMRAVEQNFCPHRHSAR